MVKDEDSAVSPRTPGRNPRTLERSETLGGTTVVPGERDQQDESTNQVWFMMVFMVMMALMVVYDDYCARVIMVCAGFCGG